MSEEAAFLKALSASPNDVTTRLVYADWLEERDRPVDAALQRVLACPDDDRMRLAFASAVEGVDAALAEFVRVQVELAKADPMVLQAALGIVQNGYPPGGQSDMTPAANSYAAMVRREYEHLRLTSPGIRAWLSLPGLLYSQFVIPVWAAGGVGQCDAAGWQTDSDIIEAVPRRGFIESITCTAADWIQHAPAIRAAQPVRKVKLTTWADRFSLHQTSEGEESLRLDGEEVSYVADTPASPHYREQSLSALTHFYPGIEFELPPPPTTCLVDTSGFQGLSLHIPGHEPITMTPTADGWQATLPDSATTPGSSTAFTINFAPPSESP